jgi:predicted flap endonuclease-1-like 5' DNA nuclease
MCGSEQSDLLEQIRGLSATEFERFVAALWELQGWTTERTDPQGDGGRDVIAERTLPFHVRIKIEAKCWSDKDNIGSNKLRQYARLPGDVVDHAVVVTSASLTRQAERTAAQHNIKIVDSDRLVELVQILDATPLLTDDLPVDDWQAVWSSKHMDWTTETANKGDTVDAIKGIGEHRAEKLTDVGIQTVPQLMTADPVALADQTEFAESRLRRWVNLATFHMGGEPVDTINAIDQQEAKQLSAADIYTVEDLEAACPQAVASETEFAEQTLKQWVGDAAYRDATPVTGLTGVGTTRAKELAKAGIFTVDDLADADRDDVCRLSDLTEQFIGDLIRQARA